MRTGRALAVVLGLLAITSVSQAALIDFSELTPGAQGTAASVIEDGFQFTCTTWDNELLIHQHDGSNWISTSNWDQTIELKSVDDIAFSLDSLKINAWSNAGWAAGPELVINGYDGATLVNTTSSDWPATPQTLTLNWTGLTSVDFVWSPAWGDITDIVATVPEPASLSILGLAGLMALRRRRA
jgi:hypothetical protein